MPTLAEAARHLKPRRRARRLPPLILMTDSIRLPDPDASILALAPGSAVVLRERCRARLSTLARRISPLCRARRIRLLVAGDCRLAHDVGAGGLHLPEAAIRHGPGRWRRMRRDDWIVTAAAHSPSAIRLAARLGVDAVLLSPVFATASHPYARTIGPLRFARWVRESPLPVYALGGIDAGHARRLRGSGAAGFAGIGGLMVPVNRRPELDPFRH
jgi:thiamine-phosphate pyrophosphorylase